MRPSAARNRRPSNDRLIYLELFTDFFNEIDPFRPLPRRSKSVAIGGKADITATSPDVAV